MEFDALVNAIAGSPLTSGSIILGVVVAIIGGLLVPGRTHKAIIASAERVAEEHRLASEKKDLVIQRLLTQNSTLLAGVRIADKFYRDLYPDIEDTSETRPHSGGPNVVQ